MPLAPKVTISKTSSTAIIMVDGTGLYDSISNPGGWGIPNHNKTDVQGILYSLTPLSKAEAGFVRLSDANQVDYLYQDGVPIALSNGQGVLDGVYVVHILLGFSNVNAMSSAAGSYQFTMANANQIFAKAIGFSIDNINNGVAFQIDRTKPLTNTGGFVTTPLPFTNNAVVTVYFDCQTNALVSEAGFACLNKAISEWAAIGCCDAEDLNPLLDRYGEHIAMNNKFNTDQDYAGADALARKLQLDCQPANGLCTPLGTQANVPFTGNRPIITLQPVTQSVAQGAEVAFSVVATGSQPLYYQWYRNGILLPGEVGSTYTITSVQNSDTATFHVVVSNAYGSVESNEVSLTVGASVQPVTITQQPISTSGAPGGNASFTVIAAGGNPIAYQWYKNGALMPGQTNAVLNITGIQPSDVATYYVAVSGPVNSVTSNNVTLSLGITAGWGWTVGVPQTPGDLQAAQGSAQFQSGGTIVADFRTNTNPLILWMYEPVTEPIKVKWFGDPNNNGNIGDPNNDLFAVTVISSFRVYYTVFPTLQTGTTIQFLTA